MDQIDKKIIQFLIDNPNSTAHEISKTLGIAYVTVISRLSMMLVDGFVSVKRVGRIRKWSVKKIAQEEVE